MLDSLRTYPDNYVGLIFYGNFMVEVSSFRKYLNIKIWWKLWYSSTTTHSMHHLLVQRDAGMARKTAITQKGALSAFGGDGGRDKIINFFRRDTRPDKGRCFVQHCAGHLPGRPHRVNFPGFLDERNYGELRFDIIVDIIFIFDLPPEQFLKYI